MTTQILSLVFTLNLGCFSTMAQFSQTAKVVANNRESRAEHGTSVDINDVYAVVGTARETIASGAAYVYKKEAENWNFSQRLAAHDPNMGAEFGGGVKLADDYMVIAAGRADVNGTIRAGALYVYDLLGNEFQFSTKLIASDFSDDAKLGMNPTSLAIDENTIVAGAPGENVWIGAVYVFEKENGVWEQKQKINSREPQQIGSFGIGVAISGNEMVIGANEVNGTKGAAYVYRKVNEDWEYQQTLMASDATAQDFFGTSVSLAGEQMVIGAYGSNADQGAAYVFEKNAQGSWVEIQKLLGHNSPEIAQFGWCTDLQENHLVIGAPHLYGLLPGEVYYFRRGSSGFWEEQQLLLGSDTQGEDFYGWSVAIGGNQVIAGAPWEDEDETGNNPIDRAGSAYIFRDPNLLSVKHQQAQINSLFPNPTSGPVNFISRDEIDQITVFSAKGAFIHAWSGIKKQKVLFDLSTYPDGLYFVNIRFKNGRIIHKKMLKY